MHFSRITKTISLSIGLTLLFVSAFAFGADKKAPDEKVAMVNGVIISRKEFNQALERNKKQLAARGRQITEEQMTMFKNEVLEAIIVMELLYQESEKKGIHVKPEFVSDQLTAFKKQFPNETQFKTWIEENNFTESDFRDELERRLTIRQLIEKEVHEKVQITDEETKSYYDKNPQFFHQPELIKASHIIIKVDAGASQDQRTEARNKIKEVQKKLQNGEDFATLAKTYSEDGSGQEGGNLGYFERGRMVKPFEEAAFALKPNEISDIVETEFGYHLIKVEDKKPERTMTYAEVKDTLNEKLKKQKVELEVNQYVDNLVKSAKIEKFL